MGAQKNFSSIGRARRRSSRVKVKIPITLHSSAGGGSLAGETVSVSKFGARVLLRAPQRTLACGDTVAIAINRARQSRTGRVVWLDKDTGAHCGIEIEQPRDFWGVYFPGSAEEEVGASGSSTAENLIVISGPSLHAPVSPSQLPLPPAAPTMRATIPTVADHEFVALVSGVSAIYSSFTERIVLAPGASGELTGQFTTPVKPGTRIRVDANSRHFYGEVLAVTGKGPQGKSRVRLKILPADDSKAN